MTISGPPSPPRTSAISCCGRQRRQFGNQPVDQLDQGDGLQLGLGRAGKKPQIGDHFVDPHRLGVDQRQRPAALGIGFFLEEELCPAGDDRQGVVDFVARAGGEFRQRGELLLIEGLPKAVFQVGQACQAGGQRRQPVGQTAQRGHPALGDGGAAAAGGLDGGVRYAAGQDNSGPGDRAREFGIRNSEFGRATAESQSSAS